MALNKRMPTLQEVADAAKVSLMTASRAINNRGGVSAKTRERVVKIAAELGYVVNRAAQKLSGGKSHILGIVAADLEDPFMSAVVTGATQVAWAAGYEALVYPQADREKRPAGSVMDLLQQIADGVVAVLPLEYGYLGDLAALNIPVITIDQRGKHAEFPSIATDGYEGARMAVQHLAALGHQRIGFIAGDERLVSAQERHRAYTDTLAQLDIARDTQLVVAGGFTQAGGFAAAQKLLALESPPTAIFAANDMSAFGAIAAIREAGMKVPDDISVVGFDDIPNAAHFHPPLSTVRQPLNQMGRAAVNALLAQIAGIDAVSPQIWLPTELVVRASTAAPKAR